MPQTGSGSVDSLRHRINEIVKDLDFNESKTSFSTQEDKHAGDAYFLNSGGNISYFWEEKAWKDGKLV